MKTGVIDTRGDFHELHFYKILDLFEVISKTAFERDPGYKKIFEEKYRGKITRFSPLFEFCVHELGWMVYDPFCLGKDEVMFSNGNRSYVASVDYIKKEGFERRKVQNEQVGFPVLTDELIKYNESLETIEGIGDGIIDEKGYVSSSFVPTTNDLAQIMLMHKMMNDEAMYNDYMQHRAEYSSALAYLTSKKNVIAINRLNDGRYTLSFVSENDGKVQNFIDAITASGKLAELKMIDPPGDEGVMKVV